MTKKSDSNEYWTRPEDYKEWCDMFGVTPRLDAAATEKNRKCQYFFTKKDNALEQEWLVTLLSGRQLAEDVYVNPPLGKGMTKKFILKAYEQWHNHNINILMIVPAGVISRGYFRPIWELFKIGKIIIEPIFPRPSFLYKGKEPEWSARNDYIAILFRRHK